MKHFTITAALILTIISTAAPKAQAAAVALATVGTTGVLYISGSTASIGEASANKQAEAIIADGADYFQTGHMSLLLESGVAQVKSENQNLSTDEAVDVLLDVSATILSL